jgi:hypothetical protein
VGRGSFWGDFLCKNEIVKKWLKSELFSDKINKIFLKGGKFDEDPGIGTLWEV